VRNDSNKRSAIFGCGVVGAGYGCNRAKAFTTALLIILLVSICRALVWCSLKCCTNRVPYRFLGVVVGVANRQGVGEEVGATVNSVSWKMERLMLVGGSGVFALLV
jgi:hypothetical protein